MDWDFTSALRVAETYLGESVVRESVLASLRENLAGSAAFRPVPPATAADSGRPVVCVDGAVTSTQTDVLTWVAVAATNSDGSVDHTAAAATVVGSHVTAVRSAIMAVAELHVAVQTAERYNEVWMDGSLATPLISIATSLSAVPTDAADGWSVTLREAGAVEVLEQYVELAHQGKVRALPKQDTAKVFTTAWARDVDQPPAADWLRTQRDRLIVSGLLEPGTALSPQPMPVAAVVPAQPTNSALRHLADTIRPLMLHWQDVTPYVTYLAPRFLDRPVKIEFTAAASESDSVAVDLCARIDPLCRGPRVLEPLPQAEVDFRVKRQVQLVDSELLSSASTYFGDSYPDATRTYRTAG